MPHRSHLAWPIWHYPAHLTHPPELHAQLFTTYNPNWILSLSNYLSVPSFVFICSSVGHIFTAPENGFPDLQSNSALIEQILSCPKRLPAVPIPRATSKENRPGKLFHVHKMNVLFGKTSVVNCPIPLFITQNKYMIYLEREARHSKSLQMWLRALKPEASGSEAKGDLWL